MILKKEKPKKLYSWHHWFAWFPIETLSRPKRIVWLEKVWRIRIQPDHDCGWVYEVLSQEPPKQPRKSLRFR